MCHLDLLILHRKSSRSNKIHHCKKKNRIQISVSLMFIFYLHKMFPIQNLFYFLKVHFHYMFIIFFHFWIVLKINFVLKSISYLDFYFLQHYSIKLLMLVINKPGLSNKFKKFSLFLKPFLTFCFFLFFYSRNGGGTLCVANNF